MATSPRMMPPGQDDPNQQGPGPGGAPVSPQEATPDPNASVLMWVRDIVANARRISAKFPAAAQEMRDIMNSIQRAQQKIVQSQPPSEPMAPPT